jgi:hypothetical protein
MDNRSPRPVCEADLSPLGIGQIRQSGIKLLGCNLLTSYKLLILDILVDPHQSSLLHDKGRTNKVRAVWEALLPMGRRISPTNLEDLLERVREKSIGSPKVRQRTWS